MDVINLKEKGAQIPNLYQYDVIAKMNNHNFTLVRIKDRTLDFHTHPESDEVFFIVEGKMRLEFNNTIVDFNTGDMCVSEGCRTPANLYFRGYMYVNRSRRNSKSRKYRWNI
jgi:hypothetical protein